MLADALGTYAPEDSEETRTPACFAAAIISWAMAAWTYVPLKYPPDVLYGLGIERRRFGRQQAVRALSRDGLRLAGSARSDDECPVLERRQLRPAERLVRR